MPQSTTFQQCQDVSCVGPVLMVEEINKLLIKCLALERARLEPGTSQSQVMHHAQIQKVLSDDKFFCFCFLRGNQLKQAIIGLPAKHH